MVYFISNYWFNFLFLLLVTSGYEIYRLSSNNRVNQPKSIQNNTNLNFNQTSRSLTLPQKQILLVNSNLKVVSNTGLQGNLNIVGQSTLQGNVIIGGNLSVFKNIKTSSLHATSIVTITINGQAILANSFQGNGSKITNVNALALNFQLASYYLNASNLNFGTVSPSRLLAVITLQGNSFNQANQLVQLNTLGSLLALNGSKLTNVINATELNFQLPLYYLDAYNLNSGVVSDSLLNPFVPLTNINTPLLKITPLTLT